MNPTDMDQIHEILFRLGLATLFGTILGIDRDLHRKPAGLRVATEHFIHHIAKYVGQSTIATLKMIHQTLVVKSK